MIRRDTHQAWDLFDDHELVIDSFAGGGGASIGIELGLGRRVDVAINHNLEAVAMHRLNHPHTRHLCQDVWEADPREVCGDRPIGLAWFSPDCTHFSKARGGKPIRTTKSRDLAWVVIRWAATVRPRVIMLENVEEFVTWGPLVDGRPCPKRKGHTFRSWTRQLRQLGYDVQWRELRAHDYGTPTIRKRLFLVARCDGQPIVWPEITHGQNDERSDQGHEQGGEAGAASQGDGRGGQHSRRSVLETGRRASCRPDAAGNSSDRDGSSGGLGTGRSRLRSYRTAAECIDWSIPCPSIFERKRPLAENTLKRIAAGIKRYVIDAAEPFIVPLTHHGKRRNHPMGEPMPTVTGAHRGEHALCVPTLVGAGGSTYAGKPVTLNRPIGTIKCEDRRALVSAFINRLGQTGGGGKYVNASAEPLTTITTKAEHCLTAVNLLHNTTGHAGGKCDEPLHTLTTGNHAGLVAALLVKYYGSEATGHAVDAPIGTIPTRDRFGLVTVTLNGEPYIITDIGMRMLQPHELYRAQGFPADYVIDHGTDADGRRIDLTKTAQVRMVGNSVCPPVVEALVRANLVDVPQPADAEEVMA